MRTFSRSNEQEPPMEKVHIYVVYEQPEETLSVVEADQEPRANRRTPTHVLSRVACFSLLVLLLSISLVSSSTEFTTVLKKTLTLTLALHPTATQVPLLKLPEISEERQVTVPTTGRVHQDATYASGLLTFYNGLFVPQTVPMGTTLVGKDGMVVVTEEQATLPEAKPSTPPTYGTVSVIAESSRAGAAGNIPASDIDTTCCGGSILAQNLSAFRGGKDAQDLTVMQQSDLSNAAATLRASLDQDVSTQAQAEQTSGVLLLPLSCATRSISNHQEGDQATSVTVSESEHCTPLAYTLASVQQQAVMLIRQAAARSSTVVQVSMLLLSASVTDADKGVGTLTIAVTAWVQSLAPD